MSKLHEVTFTLTISQRHLGGIRIRGRQYFEDIYLAGNDVSAVMRDLGPVIQTILSHNHGATWLNDEAASVTDATAIISAEKSKADE